ncbi:hypothetical protein IMZ31_05160 [Pontibacillus sp. ALD_SL1]|uniref:hypothetical protein n=1 Tax=Pontibacillus sp. ALD_SL1 TaxID=2777185 RepID=UPI001A972974|nr:hypothetical protein [Pontibacillus sp. ALD_SL1]QST00962.1 hypothetical protein IMZ31_05160 [Pontibacillus sp. ALD_SL1]
MALPINEHGTIELTALGIGLYFQTGRNEVKVHSLSPDQKRHNLMETIVEVFEYQKWSVLWIDWKANRSVTVRLPSKDGEENSLKVSLGKHQQVQPLFDPATEDTFPWPCGTFLYEVDIEGQTYYGAVRIIPHHFSKQQFNRIAEYLEKALDGLTTNYYQDVSLSLSPEQLIGESDLRFLRWLDHSFRKLKIALDWIEKENQMNVRRHYQVESHPGRMDQQSVKWEHSFKGAVMSGTKFYNRKHRHDANLPENQLVKFRTKAILKRMDTLIQSLEQERLVFLDEQDKLKGEIRQIQSDRSSPLHHVTSHDQTLLKNKQKSKEKTQEAHGLKISNMDQMLQKVKPYRQQLRYVIRQGFWNDVDDVHPRVPRSVQSRGYISFHKLWHELEESGGRKVAPAAPSSGSPLFHSTGKMYEYYTLLTIVQLITERGYNFKQDSLMGQLQKGYLHSELQGGTTVVLANEDAELHVVYEQELEHRSRDAIANGTYFFSKFRRKKPDIRMDYYKKQEDVPLYHSSIAVEVKYSPLRNIYSPDGNTKAAEQMNEYVGIKYYCPIRKSFYNRIREVLCVYPGSRAEPALLDSEAGKFIQLYPTEDGAVGMEALGAVLDGWLDPEVW